MLQLPMLIEMFTSLRASLQRAAGCHGKTPKSLKKLGIYGGAGVPAASKSSPVGGTKAISTEDRRRHPKRAIIVIWSE